MADIETLDHEAVEHDPMLEIAALMPAHRRLPELLAPNPSFGSSEHRELGDRLYIWAAPSLAGVNSNFLNGQIKIAPDIILTYGQIIALAGDLYGIPDRSISSGETVAEQRQRFLDAFDTLVNCDRAELRAILRIMDEEAAHVAAALKAGQSETAGFHDTEVKDGEEKEISWDRKYADATGLFDGAHLGRYLNLAANNLDHFGKDAIAAYSAGHAEAMAKALTARDFLQKNPGKKQEASDMFEMALGMSAFADHYLTDLFSSGHLRVLRRKLGIDWDGFRGVGMAGGLMAKRQHNEDGTYGLFVRNARGECWRCYGDEHLSTFAGRENKLRAFLALQDSMDDVWRAFEFGDNPAKYTALDLIPDLDLIAQIESDDRPTNFASLYIAWENKIQYRFPTPNLDNHAWQPMVMWKWPWQKDKNSAISELRAAGKDLVGYHFAVPAPPGDNLQVPEAPALPTEWRPSTLQVGGMPGRVRYALATAGTKTFHDGRTSCDYSSDVGEWGPWITRRTGQSPVLVVPPSPDKRVTRRFLIRQYEGLAPRIACLNLTVEGYDVIVVGGNDEQRYADIHV